MVVESTQLKRQGGPIIAVLQCDWLSIILACDLVYLSCKELYIDGSYMGEKSDAQLPYSRCGEDSDLAAWVEKNSDWLTVKDYSNNRSGANVGGWYIDWRSCGRVCRYV